MSKNALKLGFRLHRSTEPWWIGTFIVAGLVLLPVFTILWLALNPTENIWPHLINTSLPGYVVNTILLMSGVGISVFLTGVTTAWLVSMYEFPMRRWFEWLLLLPLAMPAYVIAYIYTDLLEFAGPVQQLLRHLFGWQLVSDYWFPEIRSMGGAILLMGLVLYPYVYLMARSAFLEQSTYMLEVSRLLGRGPFATFFHVSLPIARPATVMGVALALMETLNDFGTVDFFAIQTLTTGLYDVWLGMGNLGGAAQIASVMLGFVILLITLEYISRRRRKFYQSTHRYHKTERLPLNGWIKWLAFGLCILPVTVGFFIPSSLLSIHAWNNLDQSWTPDFKQYVFNSLSISMLSALITIILAILIASTRRQYKSSVLLAASRMASLGYAIPGAVLAIGIIIPFAIFDNTLDSLSREWFGISTGLLLSGSIFALVFAYVVRFLAISIGAIESSLGKLTESMDMAAKTLGYGKFNILRLLHLPMIRSSVLTAALIVFVDCMKELPATLILRPFNFETLATHVYQFAADEMLEQSALGALFIVVTGLIPVILISVTITRSRQL